MEKRMGNKSLDLIFLSILFLIFGVMFVNAESYAPSNSFSSDSDNSCECFKDCELVLSGVSASPSPSPVNSPYLSSKAPMENEPFFTKIIDFFKSIFSGSDDGKISGYDVADLNSKTKIKNYCSGDKIKQTKCEGGTCIPIEGIFDDCKDSKKYDISDCKCEEKKEGDARCLKKNGQACDKAGASPSPEKPPIKIKLKLRCGKCSSCMPIFKEKEKNKYELKILKNTEYNGAIEIKHDDTNRKNEKYYVRLSLNENANLGNDVNKRFEMEKNENKIEKSVDMNYGESKKLNFKYRAGEKAETIFLKKEYYFKSSAGTSGFSSEAVEIKVIIIEEKDCPPCEIYGSGSSGTSGSEQGTQVGSGTTGSTGSSGTTQNPCPPCQKLENSPELVKVGDYEYQLRIGKGETYEGGIEIVNADENIYFKESIGNILSEGNFDFILLTSKNFQVDPATLNRAEKGKIGFSVKLKNNEVSEGKKAGSIEIPVSEKIFNLKTKTSETKNYKILINVLIRYGGCVPVRPGDKIDIVPPSNTGETAIPICIDGKPTQQSCPAKTQEQMDSELIERSVRIKITDPDGHSWGTGTIVGTYTGTNGKKYAAVITCGHLFRESKGKGKITLDLFGSNSKSNVPATLLNYFLTEDIALIAIDTNYFKNGVISAKVSSSKDYGVNLGETAINVGCSNGKYPTVQRGKVNLINQYMGSSNIHVNIRSVEGRSGGGLFNSCGEMVGVLNADDPAYGSLFGSLKLIHEILDKNRLSFLYKL